MVLNHYLKRACFTTGPLSKNTSHSGLEEIKKYLLVLPQFKGDEKFLRVGNALHEQFLLNKHTYQLNSFEKIQVQGMVESLNKNVVVKSLMQGSVREEKLISNIKGVGITYILDIMQSFLKRGADLKTTTCSNLHDFILKAITFGYFRQGKIYKLAANLKHFYFIGVKKEQPHNIFILDVSKYPQEERYAEEELKFLLYFYRHYGKIANNGETSDQLKIQKVEQLINIKMTKPEKQMAFILEQAKEYKKNLKELNSLTKHVEKSKLRLSKKIEKLPFKTKELYSEYLEKLREILLLNNI